LSPGRTRPRGLLAALSSELGYGLAFVRRHPFRLFLPFVGVLLPLWGFAALATELREGDVFFFDVPVLVWLHLRASPSVDAFFQLTSQVGYLWGVVPADVLLLLWLAWRRRYRDGLFFGLAVLGSLGLNIGAKAYFARTRPDLWLSLAPESTYSFPSGHAMGSATLALAVALLAWHSRWRWPVAVAGATFVLLVGLSRVYLGVHYPSDILAGWAAATAWVVAMYQLTVTAPAPPRAASPRRDAIVQVSAAASPD
jgi:membrane-associated phospholipid phosphatase